MESPPRGSSFKNLVGTIESLLGSKSDFTVTWAQTVKLIAEDLSNSSCPSTPCTPCRLPVCDREEVGLEGELTLLRAAYALSNVHRKIALNKLLDLKGNIRVFCRVRSPLPSEALRRSPLLLSGAANEVQVSACGKTKSFKFDKLFPPASSQDDVFAEVEPIIRSAMDGSNVCIFAYGQTGTGKTFTMEGSQDCPGIVPRALQQLFFDASLDGGVSYSFKLSMLEVYRGSLRDLLVTPQKDQHAKSLCIQMDGHGCMEIENLTELPISSASEAGSLYRRGMRARSTSWTTANEASSRSHCLVRITISCAYGKADQKRVSKLWLVDLGGSERFFKTQAAGRTLEEGRAINASLCALGDVITALQRRQSHIPYRNSKLTQILRDCLGKNSKALMLVHVSPKEEDVGETLCSLGFASKAKAIHLGGASMKDERAILMEEVLSNMKMYEDECQKLSNNIRMMEALLRSTEEEGEERAIQVSSSSTAKAVEQNSVPRFMTPTTSSERKKRASVVSFTMEQTMQKRVVKGSETKQVRRVLNFQIDERKRFEVKQEDEVRKNRAARHCSWDKFGKKKSGKVRRWTLECSSRISVTRH